MKALVIFDTIKGNTAEVAKQIAAGFGGNTKAVKVGTVGADALTGIGLLIIGSPTFGGRPSPAIQGFLDGIPETVVRTLSFAVFDTRLSWKFLKIFNFAADRVAAVIAERGGKLMAQPEGFFVKGSNGPLRDGELERASLWGRTLGS
jgi:flavodoxin